MIVNTNTKGGPIMIAAIKKAEQGWVAQFERQLNHSVEEVWSWLTENEKLIQWFPELQIGEFRDGGFMEFNMPNGTAEKLPITEIKTNSVFEFDWWGYSIRFELYPVFEGCKLVLKETIDVITGHTPKDLAGWDVCLEVIKALMAGKTIEWRAEKWKEVYEEYVQAIGEIS
jgi:hypothetical protein